MASRDSVLSAVDAIEHVLSALYDWSGVSDDTPGDTEVIATNSESITLDDLREAFGGIQHIKDSIR